MKNKHLILIVLISALSLLVGCVSHEKRKISIAIYYDKPLFKSTSSIPIEYIKSIDTIGNFIVFDQRANGIFLNEIYMASGKPYLKFKINDENIGRIYLLPGTSSVDWDFDSPYVIIPASHPKNPLSGDTLKISTTPLNIRQSANLSDSLKIIYSQWVPIWAAIKMESNIKK